MRPIACVVLIVSLSAPAAAQDYRYVELGAEAYANHPPRLLDESRIVRSWTQWTTADPVGGVTRWATCVHEQRVP